MNIEDIRKSGFLIFECVSGSRSYGLDLPTSDTDFKGVFILPQVQFYGLESIDQVSSKSNDIIFYELKRFVELLSKNNPNLLELLAIPQEFIVFKHPLFDLLKPEYFLSKLCYETFANYAQGQMRIARGLNKKIINPVDKERKSIIDFCYVIEGQGSISLKEWLQRSNYRQEHCGLVNIPHIRDVYGIYYDRAASLGFKGIVKSDQSHEVVLSSIPKGMQQQGLMSFNENAYKQYCKAYKEYWEWVEERNEERYQNTLEHGKNYDAKNMMHTFRLLDMAEEIASEKSILVKRPNREELLKIRQGAYSYDELVEKANQKLANIKTAFEKSELPLRPDMEKINDLLVTIRTQYYLETAAL